jgi:hypothetical protein
VLIQVRSCALHFLGERGLERLLMPLEPLVERLEGGHRRQRVAAQLRVEKGSEVEGLIGLLQPGKLRRRILHHDHVTCVFCWTGGWLLPGLLTFRHFAGK